MNLKFHQLDENEAEEREEDAEEEVIHKYEEFTGCVILVLLLLGLTHAQFLQSRHLLVQGFLTAIREQPRLCTFVIPARKQLIYP